MRKHYIFKFGERTLADWYATEEQMIFHAQGMVMGLRVFRQKVAVDVYEVQEDGTRKLARIQR